MDITACMKKVDRYLAKENVQPMIVDVQNRTDMAEFITHYNVRGNSFIDTSAYCNKDEYPRIDILLDELSRKSGNVFVTGLTSFLRLQGEQVLCSTLVNFLGMATAGRVVIITYQCERYLSLRDPRLSMRICVIDGVPDNFPTLVFSDFEKLIPTDAKVINGINGIAGAIEKEATGQLYVKTGKQKCAFPLSLYSITEMNKAYDVLLQCDPSTAQLDRVLGSDEQWNYALKKFTDKESWAEVIDTEFGSRSHLDLVFPNFTGFDSDKQWLYFIGLHMFGAKSNWCLNEVSQKAAAYTDISKQVYRSLLSVSYDNVDFSTCYQSRKALLKQLGNPIDEDS